MGETLQLKRECDVVEIPAGNHILLPAGTEVTITQVLGGSYTVAHSGGLARIDGRDADALGREPELKTPATAGGPLDEKQLWDQMRTCYDPEIPVNIVDLGLIYDCKISPLGDGRNRVDVKMTLTAPGCGMGEVLKQDVENKLMCLEGVDEAAVELIWDPPWNQGMMTEAARLQLGLM